MKSQIIKFLHISDSHFGAHFAAKSSSRTNKLRKEYGERFFIAIKQILDNSIIKDKIDFVIHTGDFFNRSKPPPNVMEKAISPFSKVAEKIPIYFIPGNHERSKLPFGLISFQDNVHIFRNPCSYFFNKGKLRVKITGIPYIRYNARVKFWQNLKNEGNIKSDFSILALHQLLSGSKIETYTFRNGQNVLEKSNAFSVYDYIACGHVHRFQWLYPKTPQNSSYSSLSDIYTIKQDLTRKNWHFSPEMTQMNRRSYPNPVIAYSGSMERVSFVERFESKGYIIGEIHIQNEIPVEANYRFHPIDSIPMEYQSWNLSTQTLKEYVKEFQNTIEQNYPKRYDRNQSVSCVARIQILGRISEEENEILRDLQTFARRHDCYLTIYFASNPVLNPQMG